MSGMDVGYTYSLNWTEDELKLDNLRVKKNRVELKMAFCFTLAFLDVGSFELISSRMAKEFEEKKEPVEVVRPKTTPEQNSSAKNGILFKTASGDLIDENGQQVLETVTGVRGGEGPSASPPSKPSSSSRPAPLPSQPASSASRHSSLIKGVAKAFQASLIKSPFAGRGKALLDTGRSDIPQNAGEGSISKNESTSSPRKTTPTDGKAPRLPSGFCKDYTDSLKNQGLGGMPSPSGTGSSVEYDSGLAKKRSKSEVAGGNVNPFYSKGKKGKQSENPRYSAKRQREIKRQQVYDRYKEFKKELLKAGFDDVDIDCSLERFESMCRDPKSGKFTALAMFQAEGGLWLEAEGVITDVQVNKDPSIAIDLKATLASTGQTIYLDSKRAINYGNMVDNFGNLVADTAKVSDPRARAFNSGKSAVDQQNTWADSANGIPIYEFYDLVDYWDNPAMVADLIGSFLDGVEQMGGDEKLMLFTRTKTKYK